MLDPTLLTVLCNTYTSALVTKMVQFLTLVVCFTIDPQEDGEKHLPPQR